MCPFVSRLFESIVMHLVPLCDLSQFHAFRWQEGEDLPQIQCSQLEKQLQKQARREGQQAQGTGPTCSKRVADNNCAPVPRKPQQAWPATQDHLIPYCMNSSRSLAALYPA